MKSIKTGEIRIGQVYRYYYFGLDKNYYFRIGSMRFEDDKLIGFNSENNSYIGVSRKAESDAEFYKDASYFGIPCDKSSYHEMTPLELEWFNHIVLTEKYISLKTFIPKQLNYEIY